METNQRRQILKAREYAFKFVGKSCQFKAFDVVDAWTDEFVLSLIGTAKEATVHYRIRQALADYREDRINDLVAAVKSHARANYEQDGWDIVIETMTDAEIADVVRRTTTREGAIRKMKQHVNPYHSRRTEIQNLAF